jgi:hypothetical protein
VEGFSRVRKCSTEGRALMSMDLQVKPCNVVVLLLQKARSCEWGEIA